MMNATGNARAWVFSDNIDTDLLAPGRFMHRPIEELAQNCLIDLSPEFAAKADKGDVLIAGRNFGVGSSREQAAEALKVRGLVGVVAQSFAGIFYRNAINLGLPVLVLAALQASLPRRWHRRDDHQRQCARPARQRRAERLQGHRRCRRRSRRFPDRE